jgi:hypothetical protein
MLFTDKDYEFLSLGSDNQKMIKTILIDVSHLFQYQDMTGEVVKDRIEDAFAQVPEEYRDEATINFDIHTPMYCDTEEFRAQVKYKREETDEEFLERLAFFEKRNKEK